MRCVELCAGLTLATLAACGGAGYGGSTSAPADADSRYAATLLVSDQAGSGQQDAQLSNPWGLAVGGGSALWLTSQGTARSRLLNAADLSLPVLDVAVPPQSDASARPTGAAFNPGNGFEVSAEGRGGVARFIVASEGGTLSGWSPALGLDHALVAFDGSAAGAVYTGLAMTPQGVDSVLLAADFRNGVVDRFGADFTRLPAEGRFADAALPAGYAPFAIAASGERVYMAYAKPDATAHLPQAGAGLGLVDVFDFGGRLLQRLVPAGGALNAPWGLAVAPAGFGAFSGALLVANGGDGTIAAFDTASGRLLGTLMQGGGAVLAIDGLHAIAFGSGAAGLPATTLFFTAGPQGGRHGVLGRIDLQ
ncbi:MAG: TIGR03118 family protein [Rubrivivax sp.]